MMDFENKEIKDFLAQINDKYGDTLKRLAESEKEDQKFFKALYEIEEILSNEIEKEGEAADAWWEALSYADKLKAFQSVCKRIHKGDIKDRGSYRHVLYQVFGFGKDAYALGMHCGYMDIHNSIVLPDKEEKD